MLLNFSKLGYLVGSILDQKMEIYCGGKPYKNYTDKYSQTDFEDLLNNIPSWVEAYPSLFKNIIN